MALIELQEVSKIFGFGDATTLALDEVGLTVEKGEFVAIMGPSGCGKTTLMNIIGVLDKPSYGSYLLDSRHVSRFSSNRQARLRRDRIGFVFQSFNLLPNLNVLDNVALPLTYKGTTPVRRRKIASDILEIVGLREREYFYPKQLSQGQIQRVAIARALINKPQIIIADEPTGNLDSVDSRVVMELFSDIHRQGNTVLLVTHNPELTRYATRVIYMQDGRIIGDEKTAIGDVAKGAKASHYRKHKTTGIDVAAGVSALMHNIPAKELEKKPKEHKLRKKRPYRKKRTKR
jgi:putative ABC transport system ATP-binding protein